MKFDLKSIMNVQKEIEEIQSKFAEKTYTGTSGGGMVSAVVNGRNEIISVQIEEKAWEDIKGEGDRELLQDLIVAAVNDALRQSQEQLRGEMSSLLGNLNIPGLSRFFG